MRLVHEIVHEPDGLVINEFGHSQGEQHSGSPSFDAVATGKTFIFENASFMSAVNFTMAFHLCDQWNFRIIYFIVNYYQR